MKLQTSGVLGTSYAIAKLAPKRAPIISSVADGIKFRGYSPEELLLNTGSKFLVEDVYQEAGIHYLKFKQIQ